MNERVVVISPGQLQVGRKKLIRVFTSLDALGARAVWRVRISKEAGGLAVMEEMAGNTTVVTGFDKDSFEYGYFEISLLPRRPGKLVIDVASGNEKFGNWRIESVVTDPNGLANGRHVSMPAVAPALETSVAPPAEELPAPPPAAPGSKKPCGFWQRFFKRGQ